MATIRKTSTGTFRVDWKDPARKSQSKTFPTRAQAVAHRDTIITDATSNRSLDTTAGRRTVQSWGAEWLAHTQRSPGTQDAYERRFRLYVTPTLGHRRIIDVDRALCRAFVAELQRAGKGERTIEGAVTVLGQIMKYAVAERAIPDNPATRLGLRAPAKKERRFLTREEAEKLMAVMPSLRDSVMVGMAAFAGLRVGEVLGLRVQDFNTSTRSVMVSGQLSRHGNTRGDTKNHRARRVTYPTFLAPTIETYLATIPAEGFAFRTHAHRRPLQYTDWYRKVWLTTVRENGYEGLRFHDLRHTYAALLIGAGAPPLAISQALGHGSIGITMDVYGHLFPEMIKEWVEKI